MRFLCRVALCLLASCAAATANAETHQFKATHFYITYSASHPPALRIKPGDRVVTQTIDAEGRDAADVKVADTPNPQIGPFFIEGAEPGDTLVVKLVRVETNRGTARMGGSWRRTRWIRSFCAPGPNARPRARRGRSTNRRASPARRRKG